ncbi:MAG: cyclopropane fatty acyl phospholipid synthase [Chloroflexi bacterium]|nr:cyclopropane fatty acyl phospholipid synthase [Chloroflexota bacterium]
MQKLAESAGVILNGPNPWDIQVHDDRWYARVFRDKSLGLGESYMDGWWDCEQVDEMIFRVLCGRIDEELSVNMQDVMRLLPEVLFNLQSMARARMIAEHHYDLGNDLFHSFLDPYNQYSCGYFEGTEALDQAQMNKLALISEKLDLIDIDRVLDIGCGWGGFARYAAERYGCTVTAVNISQEQLRYAREFCAGLPVTFLDSDYRAIDGRFDKIVSVGMFEHVGQKNYRTFMEVAHRCLEKDGIFLLHTIGSNQSQKGIGDPWIAKYIFPNSSLPSTAQIAKAAEGLFVIEDLHNLGAHYDKTLMAWNDNFQKAWPQLKGRYGERFKRMWEYYLLSSAGAFRARNIQIWQVVMTKANTGTPQPRCRFSIADEMQEHFSMGIPRQAPKALVPLAGQTMIRS